MLAAASVTSAEAIEAMAKALRAASGAYRTAILHEGVVWDGSVPIDRFRTVPARQCAEASEAMGALGTET